MPVSLERILIDIRELLGGQAGGGQQSAERTLEQIKALLPVSASNFNSAATAAGRVLTADGAGGTGWSWPPFVSGVTAWVISNAASTVIKQSATELKKTFGELIQICDGVADDVQIQAAIAALPANGGKVVLSEGTFNIATKINLNKSYGVLEGQGYSTILKPVNSFNSDVLNLGANWTEVCDLQVSGNSVNQASGNGIVGAARYCSLRHLYLYDVKGSGIQLTGAPSDTTLNHIRASSCAIGVDLNSPNGGFHLTSIYADLCSIAGIKLASTWINLSAFRITSCAGVGLLIAIPAAGGGINYIVAANGDIDGNAKHGIEIYSDPDAIAGVTLSDLVMGDNSLNNDNTYDSIYAHQGGNGISGLSIHDCYFYETYTRYLWNADIWGGKIHNNYVGYVGHAQMLVSAVIKVYDNYNIVNADPGNGGAIAVQQGTGSVALVTAGAETRTLAAPTYIGQELTLYCKTFVGNCVVTCATTINEAGNNTITFTATGQAVKLFAVEEGATLRWRCAITDGAVLSTV